MKALILLAVGAIAGVAGCAGQNAATSAVGGSELVAAGTTAGVASAAVPVASQSSGLVDLLVSKLGVTPAQASGGAGAIFSQAKQGMSVSDFAQVSNAVPGMDQLLSSAPAASSLTGGSGMMGAATGALGSSGGSLGSLANLAGSFQSLGLDSGMANQFVPVILDYVKGQGGTGTMSLLQSALGF